MDSFDSFCNFFNSSLDSFCINWDLQSLISRSLDISWLCSNFTFNSVIFFSSFCICRIFTPTVLDSEMPDLCIFFMESRSSEILLTLHSMATRRPSKFPMFSFMTSHCLETLLILLSTCCLDLLFLTLKPESLWQSSDSDDASDEEILSLSVIAGNFICLGVPSSLLLSSDADSNSEISSSFTLS